MATLVQQQQKKEQILKQRICELLQWDESEYANFQYETGLAYLHAYIPNDPEGADELTRSRIFWKWWINAWVQRDESFIATAHPLWRADECAHIYMLENNHFNLIKNTRPNGVVLEMTYSQMIQEFIDEINQPL